MPSCHVFLATFGVFVSVGSHSGSNFCYLFASFSGHYVATFSKVTTKFRGLLAILVLLSLTCAGFVRREKGLYTNGVVFFVF
jgi:hypothetical protein